MASEEDDTTQDRQVSVVLIGAGNRGYIYSSFALDFPKRLKVVAIVDPRKFARTRIQNEHGLPENRVFADVKDLIKPDRIADAVIIATPDRYHKDQAIRCADKGYHVLLEKPMDVTAEGCKAIVAACKRNNVLLGVCHVLHYHPPMATIKRLIDEGAIGEIINIQHLEPVGYFHFAHSYVRGNWHREEDSSFSLLAKCCHDIDLIRWWMGKYKCTKVSSFGSLTHFIKENKPDGASSRCLECSVEPTCPYSAKQLYLDGDLSVKTGNTDWPVSIITDTPTVKSVTEALRTGPYGKCVYECDNDVCDNQVVNFAFSGGRTASLSMVAFTEKVCKRFVKVFGSKGEVTFDGLDVILFDFVTKKRSKLIPPELPVMSFRLTGHGGADFYLMDSFVKAVARNDPSFLSTPEETLESHLLAFAAEMSRLESRVVSMATVGDD